MEYILQERLNANYYYVFRFSSKEEADKLREEAIKRVQKEVTVPGFRKGKAPTDLVISKYLNEIVKEFEELMRNLLSEEIDRNALKDINVEDIYKVRYELTNPSKYALVNFIKTGENFEKIEGILEVEKTLGVMEHKEVDVKDIEIEVEKRVLDEEGIKKLEKLMLAEYSENLEEGKPILETFINVKENKDAEEYNLGVLKINVQKLPKEMITELMSKNVGEETEWMEIKQDNWSKELFEFASMYIKKKQLEKILVKFRIINKISLVEPKEITDEMVKQKTRYKTVEELEEHLKEDLERGFQKEFIDEIWNKFFYAVEKKEEEGMIEILVPKSAYLESLTEVILRRLEDKYSRRASYSMIANELYRDLSFTGVVGTLLALKKLAVALWLSEKYSILEKEEIKNIKENVSLLDENIQKLAEFILNNAKVKINEKKYSEILEETENSLFLK